LNSQIKTHLFALGIFLVLLTVPAFAHHPFDPEFDWKKPVTMTGTMTKLEWANPHAVISMDVRDAKGTVANWALELGSVTVLEEHYGWNEKLLKTGEKLTVEGWLARDGSKLVSAKTVTLASGRNSLRRHRSSTSQADPHHGQPSWEVHQR
jgi:hypothetical protein